MKKGIYKHFKGNYYELLDVGFHSETLEKMVIYRSITDSSKVWVRPLSMWDEEVEFEGQIVKRFTLIKDKEAN